MDIAGIEGERKLNTIGPCVSAEKYRVAELKMILDLILRRERYTQRPIDTYLVHRYLFDLVPKVFANSDPPVSTIGEDRSESNFSTSAPTIRVIIY